MTKLKDSYFAGLIDGEGCIRLERKTERNRTLREAPTVQVKMTCLKTINALRDYFGCGSIQPYKPVKAHYKPQWRWRVRDKSAALVLHRILPYMITKRDEAEFVYSRRFIKKSNGGP